MPARLRFISSSDVAFVHNLSSVSIQKDTIGLLKAHGFLLTSQEGPTADETNHLGAVNFVETLSEAGFSFIEVVQVIPTMGEPAIPTPDT